MKCDIYIIVMFIFSVHVCADCTGISCTGVTVDRVYIYPDGSNFRFETSGDELNLDCTPDYDKYIGLDMTKAYAKETYAAILAANYSKSTFLVKTTGAGTVCQMVFIVSGNQ